MFGRAKKLLPEVPIFGFIGPIPENYGGRTGACLQRTSTFADLDERSIDILNVSPAHAINVANLNSRLHVEGRLSPRVTLRNIWNELRTIPNNRLTAFSAYSSEPVISEDDELESTEDLVSKRYASNGSLLQTDWFREDGSRAASDRRDIEKPWSRSGRAIRIYDDQGESIGQWSSTAEMYKDWFRWIFNNHPTILISDTPAYPFIRDLRDENVAVIQAIHGIHGTPPDSLTARLSTKNYPVLAHMDHYDKVAILTTAQKNDLTNIHIGTDNMVVLPNMVKKSESERQTNADRGSSGVVLSRLVKAKRIDHAVRGVFEASKSVPDLTLDIYGGDADARTELEVLLGELGLQQSVRLRGYDPKAKEHFRHARFSLLTSISEGQPLVLLESMAAGCIPIAYDIAYGPSDIITDGVDGFLVPDGNIEVLAQTIAHMAQMSEGQIRRMRKAATRRSRDFYPAQIAAQWGDLMQQTLAEKKPIKRIGGKASLRTLSTADATYRFVFSIIGLAERDISNIWLSWKSRNSSSRLFGRQPSQMDNLSDCSAEVNPTRLRVSRDTIIDFYIDLKVSNQPQRIRLRASTDDLPDPKDGVRFYITKRGFLSAFVEN